MSHESSRLILVAPESSASHQQSLWSLREFQTLEGCGGALRGANFLCQLSDRKIPQPLGFLTDLHFLHVSLFASFGHTAKLSSHSGPPPVFCQCECQHVASAHPVQEMGEKIWDGCPRISQIPLGKGKQGLLNGGNETEVVHDSKRVPLAPALSARQGAIFSVCVKWRSEQLSRSFHRDFVVDPVRVCRLIQSAFPSFLINWQATSPPVAILLGISVSLLVAQSRALRLKVRSL